MFEQAKLQEFVDATGAHYSNVLFSAICISYSRFSVSIFKYSMQGISIRRTCARTSPVPVGSAGLAKRKSGQTKCNHKK